MTKFPARSALVSAPRMKSFPFFSCAEAAASTMLGCPGSNARKSTADFAPSALEHWKQGERWCNSGTRRGGGPEGGPRPEFITCVLPVLLRPYAERRVAVRR
jgi:hypothetical protein